MRPTTHRTPRVLLFLALLAFAATAAQAAKVEICHFPPGNPDNWHTISVSENALAAHLDHGDLEGSCFANCGAICDDGDSCTQDVEPDAEVCLCRAVPEPVDCDDSNPCTADSCSSEAGACVYDTALLNGTSCDDGDPETADDVCTDGVCAGSSPISCPCDVPERWGLLSGMPPLGCREWDGAIEIYFAETGGADGTMGTLSSSSGVNVCVSATPDSLEYLFITADEFSLCWETLQQIKADANLTCI